MKYILSLTIVFLFSMQINAQNKKAYKKLAEKDFETALSSFTKEIEDDTLNALGNFGLALLYSHDENSNQDLIEAWKYIQRAKINIGKINEDEEEILKEYFNNTEVRKSNHSIPKKVNRESDIIADKFVKLIREGNDLELVNRVLTEFPDFPYYQNTVHIRNYLEYRKAEKANTIEGYNTFIESFPDAAQVPLAIKNRNKMLWENVKEKNTIEGYEKFMQDYPNAIEYQQAMINKTHLVFLKAKSANTIEAMEEFIKFNPEAMDIMLAKELLKQMVYEKAMRIKSFEAYNEFIKRYPNGAQFVDVYNLKSKDLGVKYKSSIIMPKPIKWIRAFDNEEKYEFSPFVTSAFDGNIVIAGHTAEEDSTESNAWVVGLNKDGELLWNKNIGDTLCDFVNDVAVSSTGDVYVVGMSNSMCDTLTGKSWMFKLSSSGDKIWNKTLPIDEVTSIEISDADDIYVAGYISDSVAHPVVMKINEKGKKLWQRKYLTEGKVKSMSVGAEGNIDIGSTNWAFGLNNQGYMLWESKPDTNLCLQSIVNLGSKDALVAGLLPNESKTYMARYKDGNLLWEKNIPFVDSIVAMNQLTVSPDGSKLFAAAYSTEKSYFLEFNNTGKMISQMEIAADISFKITSLSYTKENNLIIGLNAILPGFKSDYLVLVLQ